MEPLASFRHQRNGQHITDASYDQAADHVVTAKQVELVDQAEIICFAYNRRKRKQKKTEEKGLL